MIATLEAPIDAPNLEGQFLDLTQFLEIGVEYDHLTLKRISWAVGDLGLWAQEGDENYRIGGRFWRAIYDWWYAGYIEMSEAVLEDGTPTDFWTAVFMSKHPDNKHFKLVPGHLIVLGRPDDAAEVIPW
jgi:hypothetical protein